VSSGWSMKRFWAAAGVAARPEGWAVVLDGRAVKTPAKALLALPTEALARAVAEEWDAQSGEVRPAFMPLTRTANSAIDKVAPMAAAVVEEIARYGGTDLLCYRATAPAALIARQAAAWDPWLNWMAGMAAPLRVTSGIVHVAQPKASLAALTAQVARRSHFELAALYDLVAISGSLVLGLAVAEGRLEAGDAFDLARLDEDWQAEQWGEDEEAAESAALKRQAMLDAGRFLRLCR
jgi:chaperone required for assembly of F1-ATPase